MRPKGETMPKQKNDRRVTYTRTALRDALIELMHNQHISGITVKSICERADVNRSTFYLHYRDQYDLLHQVEQEVLKTLEARLQASWDEPEGSEGGAAGQEANAGQEVLGITQGAQGAQGAPSLQDAQGAQGAPPLQDAHSTRERPVTLTVMTEILEYARENAGVARVLLSENCDFAFQKDIMDLAQVVALWMDPSYSERTREYVVAFGINGCISIAEKWLKDGMVEPPEEIARLILQVLYNGTSSFEK
jgi:AcrR family transcriptional regulator